jgi:GNAT superfamily N-acetyltransferase
MHLVRPATAAEFLRLAEPFLLGFEVEHGLILGIAAGSTALSGAYWALVADGDEVRAAAIRTMPKMVLSRESVPGAMALIARDAMHDLELKAILGPGDSVAAFAAASGRSWREGRGQRIYDCRVVVPPPVPGGERRLAEPRHREMLIEWTEAFTAEAFGEARSRDHAAESVDRHVARQAMYLWVDRDQPVTCATAAAATPHGMRVGYVYTPPEHRARGYASALVASLTQCLLDDGRQFVYLYTHRANPTSNSIYQKIGYRPVADVEELWLVEP